ncbi:MAG: PDZ domain-containing protein, partial [Luteolibacter sp.]
DDVVILPGIEGEQKAVRVTGVMPNTPGQLAGIQGNDLIVKLEGDGWKDVDATPLFREKIKSKKPGSLVKMTIFREGNLIDVEVKLSRRPLMADHLQTLDLDAAEAASKEAHFQRWLAQKKLLK